MKEHPELSCALCGAKACASDPEVRRLPEFCPMTSRCEELSAVEHSYMTDEDLRRLARESARTESAGYCRWTRIEDIMDVARRMGWTKLGIAHCAGLMTEARLAREIFVDNGFEVCSICCKVGSIEKEKVGLTDQEKVQPGQFEALCNPVAQAALLAAVGAQFNVVIGLCVGHDSLFFMHSRVPATVLVAKDRVLGHNPVAALYNSHSYYRRLRAAAEPRR